MDARHGDVTANEGPVQVETPTEIKFLEPKNKKWPLAGRCTDSFFERCSAALAKIHSRTKEIFTAGCHGQDRNLCFSGKIYCGALQREDFFSRTDQGMGHLEATDPRT